MGRIEELHEIIHTNLSLLKHAGYPIDFEKDMFKERNSPGFESVGHALLMVIDPTECKNNIPWPLVNNKAQTREFRTNFAKFIKMINSRYPEAQIPEITASNLQFPGGLNFLLFMCKLSTFAIERELKTSLDSEQLKDLLPRPMPSKQTKDHSVKIKIIKGARYQQEVALLEMKAYEAKASPVFQKLNYLNNSLIENIELKMEKLRLEVASLPFDEKTKESLLNIDNSSAITDYNKTTEEKAKEIEYNSNKLCHHRDLADQCYEQITLATQTVCDAPYFDGHKLPVTRAVDGLASSLMINVDGEVRLLHVLKAGLTAITRLTPAFEVQSPLTQQVRDLRTQSHSLLARTTKLNSALQQISQQNKLAIQQLRPVLDSRMKKKKMPDYFKHFMNRPALNFVLPSPTQKRSISVKPEKRRLSLNSIIHRKKKIICSFKTRREPRKHVSSTPIFKTPACRKSLYKTLPSGTKHKHTEEIVSLEVVIPTTPSSITRPVQESDDKKLDSTNTCSSSVLHPIKPTPASRCSRKSLNDIVERFLKLKKNMSSGSNNKCDSDGT